VVSREKKHGVDKEKILIIVFLWVFLNLEIIKQKYKRAGGTVVAPFKGFGAFTQASKHESDMTSTEEITTFKLNNNEIKRGKKEQT